MDQEVAETGSNPPRRIYSKLLTAVGIGNRLETLSEDLPERERNMDKTAPGVVVSSVPYMATSY